MSKVKNITIYTTKTCPYCKMEKEYFDQKGIKYQNIFVDEDMRAAQEMIEKSGQMGVPFTEFTLEDGKTEYILGFDKARIDQVLGL